MAKANVLARRIRAYGRRVEEIMAKYGGDTDERHAARAEAKRLGGKLAKAQKEFVAFLGTRKKGPWAAFARASA